MIQSLARPPSPPGQWWPSPPGSDGGGVAQVLQKLPQKVQLPHSRLAQEGSVRNREQRSGLQNSKSLFQTKLQGEVQIETKSRNLGRDNEKKLNKLVKRKRV